MEYWTAFILGLLGSLHCAGMCGPLTLALPRTGSNNASYVGGRIAYNAGRVLTYSLLGIAFGLFGKAMLLAGIQRWLSIGLGISLMAGLFFSSKLLRWFPITTLVHRLKSAMSIMLRQRSYTALLLLGLLNGLLPCGLVYVAATSAMTIGSVFGGFIYMALFGAGTVPLMLVIGLSGKLIPISLRLKLTRAIPISIFAVATLLILRGMSLGIPYVSPDLGTGSCCSR
jgi:sulfite exporter TauE/SafE